jgi:hypothetical protein
MFEHPDFATKMPAASQLPIEIPESEFFINAHSLTQFGHGFNVNLRKTGRPRGC